MPMSHVSGFTFFVWIDDCRWALGKRLSLDPLVLDRPGVKDGRDQTDNNRTTDGWPEPVHRKSLDQVRGEFQEERIKHHEK